MHTNYNKTEKLGLMLSISDISEVVQGPLTVSDFQAIVVSQMVDLKLD